ncbi:MAG: hypothetical protein K5831_02725 [Brevundimonas sp.]|uniref:hypothetical protein n=1 Tax=Brevundimonas sp. TaxID=1871086 RepID=UPI002584C826|nr:hypothetical protein [Brevundimonas sp.]MCV0413778.1 hypothetical protein [Brevundimonas sp.]
MVALGSLFFLTLSPAPSVAQTGGANIAPLEVPTYVLPTPARLQARTLQAWQAPEADQGVAVDDAHLYVIDNTVIAKYALDTGVLTDRWVGPSAGPVRHINSCYVRDALLWCANSNYPETPMGSSVEVFDTATMSPVETYSLGLMDEGSLTWFDEVEGGRIAGFAHYDTRGGVPFKNNSFSGVVAFDPEWRRTGGWMLPKAVIERMAPHAASGGAIGPDGLLYVLGHDLPELYVMARPMMGPTLVHVATIDIEAPGQAFSWAQDGSHSIFAIDGDRHLVLKIELPLVELDPQIGTPFVRNGD